MINWIVKQRIKKLLQPVAENFQAWEAIKRVAILVKAGDQFSKEHLDKWCSEKDKEFTIFYIESHSKNPTYNNWQCITAKDIRFGLPLSTVLGGFNTKQYDLLIDTRTQPDKICDCVSASINCTNRCAAINNHTQPQLLITRNKDQLTEYLEDVIRYLKMIKP